MRGIISRTSCIALLAAGLIFAPAVALAQQEETVEGLDGPKNAGKIGRGDLEQACDNSGGIAWGTQASGGDYGCVTDDTLIMCEESGDCDGWTVEEARRPDGLRTTVLVWGEPPELADLESNLSSCPACRSLRDQIADLEQRHRQLAREYQKVVANAKAGSLQTLGAAFEAHRRLQLIAQELDLNDQQRQLLVYRYETGRY